MPARIRIGDQEATIDRGVWTAADPEFADALNWLSSAIDVRPEHGDRSVTIAYAVAAVTGGTVLEAAPEPTSDDDDIQQ